MWRSEAFKKGRSDGKGRGEQKWERSTQKPSKLSQEETLNPQQDAADGLPMTS